MIVAYSTRFGVANKRFRKFQWLIAAIEIFRKIFKFTYPKLSNTIQFDWIEFTCFVNQIDGWR